MALPQVTIPRIETLFKKADLNYSLEGELILSTWPNITLWVACDGRSLRFIALWQGTITDPADRAKALDAATHRNRNYLLPKSTVVELERGMGLRAECNFWVEQGMTDAQLQGAFDASLKSCLGTIEDFDALFSKAAHADAVSSGGEA